MLKNIIAIKRIVILILILSVSANVYYFGNQWIQKERQEIFDSGVVHVFQVANELGQVSLNLDNQQIILKKQ
jgi:hypothetical protein